MSKMTFCLAMCLKDGLVGIADTRITTGSECITATKVMTYRSGRHAFFLMTSGLRSVRDKTITYFDEVYLGQERRYDRLYKVCNLLSRKLRAVAQEDREALESAGLVLNMHTLIGGQMEKDEGHKLYLLYPQGNWVQIGTGTPYAAIGSSGYGKPVLDRTLTYADSLYHAFRVGCLAFDSTRISSADVDYPMDTVVCPKDSFAMVTRRFEKERFADLSKWWQERLRQSVNELPFESFEDLFQDLPEPMAPLAKKAKSNARALGLHPVSKGSQAQP